MTRGFTIGAEIAKTGGRGFSSGTHPGLAMGALAPIGVAEGKIPDALRTDWLSKLSAISASEDYGAWYETRWTKGLGLSLQAKVEAATRVLVGAGDASAVDVGLRVHHTWGVPCIPGSSLKGLLSHWLDVVYGPGSDGELPHPWDPAHPEHDRAKFRRADPTGRTPHGGGEVQRVLFGSPEADGDLPWLREAGAIGPRCGSNACRGRIRIHDALFVPGSAGNKPFLADVITVHHASWYRGEAAANDYESPTPIGFLSVRPGVQFLLAIDLAPGEDAAWEPWVGFAFGHLVDALAAWGIGAKTAAGYGRLGLTQQARRLEKADDDQRARIAAWLTENVVRLQQIAGGPDGPAAFLAEIEAQFGDSIRAVTGDLRKQRRQAVLAFIANELQASKSKTSAIRRIVDERYPLV